MAVMTDRKMTDPQSIPVSGCALTRSMRYMLWRVAQHKYGWTHAARYGGQIQVADGLVRRGLVDWGGHGRGHPQPTIVATDAGRALIEELWPVSPFVLGTYDHQPRGWTPCEGGLR